MASNLDKQIAALAKRFGGTKGRLRAGRGGTVTEAFGFSFPQAGFGGPGQNVRGFVDAVQALQRKNNPDFGKSPAQLAEDKANRLNEQRFQQGLDIFGEREKLLSGLGGSQRQSIADQAERLRARGRQDLISRGLNFSSGILDVERNAAGFEQRANLDLEDRLTQLRSGLLGEKTSFIERVTDQGPDLSLLTSLQRAAAGAPRRTGGRVRQGGGAGAGGPNPSDILRQPRTGGPRESQRDRQLRRGQERLRQQAENKRRLEELRAGNRGGSTGQDRLDFERNRARKSRDAGRNQKDALRQLKRELTKVRNRRFSGRFQAEQNLLKRIKALGG